MSFIAEFRDFLREVVEIQPFVGSNTYGEPQFGAAVRYAARLQGKTQLVRDMQGREVVSRQQIVLGSGDSIDPQSRITLPDGRVPVIVSTDDMPDERGDNYTVVYLA